MKALHITSHIGTTRNIENVFQYLNIKDKLLTEKCIFNGFYMNKDIANNVWDYYKDKVKQYNVIIFTDTSMIARPFLQNIEKHNLLLIIYITNRFDWGIWNITDNDYYELYKTSSKHNRVIFCSDNSYDQYYAKLYDIKFLYDEPINLTPLLCENIITNVKTKFFIYNRGTKIELYEKFLNDRNIEYDIFGEHKTRFIDSAHICEYKGFIHLPYQTNIQSLWENLGYYIIYFIPSKRFITELILNSSWYYWEEKNRSYDILINSIELSQWYNKENELVFEYFDSWDELQFKSLTLSDEYLLNKKIKIKDFIEKNNFINLEKWSKILSIIKL